ncbi:MAG: hypothetical protein UT30_C0005G0012 [Candidatus Uhrbacteria bacterium GW2011_GWF2_39_13]|uniref:Rod shape-determining protein MreD n=1 Tax=Candidatus Uhrbacteria bacterium GW2011_GWF2_39_13 TaxID=1618995 RepID=A0A0G0MKU0_9BACT|nr:MAG: hypothetical protein UT30_C0005G0012 [Candidatus Uhrbacteria bacterium GW2011_GWF2_39_13]HAU66588.1 hypothetical protein [Candidatus Uhrbacteria bacterium]
MIKTGIFLFLFFLTLQVSFIFALPFPFDRTPFLLLMTLYFYQYLNQTNVWWWLIFYGIVLDFFSISYAPLETISYSILVIVIIILAKQIFTNRSFYAISATMIICLFVLTVTQVLSIFILHFFNDSSLPWLAIVKVNVWAVFLGCSTLFLLFPFIKQTHSIFHRFFFKGK